MSKKIQLKASKFSGLGNKILLVDLIKQQGEINLDSVINIVKEKRLKFDQLISIESPHDPELDLNVKIFNKDGSRAENCVNGARCLAKYVSDSGLISKKKFLVGVGEKVWKIYCHENDEYSVEQEAPNFLEGKHLLPKPDSKNQHQITISKIPITISYVNLGNPHAIFFTSDIYKKPLEVWGKELQNSEWFPKGINFGLAEILSPTSLALRVYERGVGETLACGSSACAAVVLGNHLELCKENVGVVFKTGTLNIRYQKTSGRLTAKGTAEFLGNLMI